jgi:hypothetical protein
VKRLLLLAALVMGCGTVMTPEKCKKLCSPYAVQSYGGYRPCECDTSVKEIYPERVE